MDVRLEKLSLDLYGGGYQERHVHLNVGCCWCYQSILNYSTLNLISYSERDRR